MRIDILTLFPEMFSALQGSILGRAQKEEKIEKDGFVYRIMDVTKGARVADRLASERIFELGKLKRKDAPMPDISPSEHCEKPYRCWYYDFCHKE